MIGPAPMCVTCKRYRPETVSCEAYPEGIPSGILDSRLDHRVPQAGDRGLQYVNAAGDPDFFEPWWPIDGEPDAGGEA